MTRKLYIHIGCHKTGSTSIQYALAENTETLAQNGLTFFRDNRTPDAPDFPDVHSWLGPVEEGKLLPLGFKAIETDRLSDTLAALDTNVVISSENFSFLFHHEPIADIQRSLSRNFDDIRIICYLRRQDRHAVSHKQEGSKPNRGPEYALWGNNINPLPPYRSDLDLYLDYNRRLGIWADIFGDHNVTLRLYEPDRLKNGNSVDDFFHILGLTPPSKPQWRNTSQNAIKIILGHIITSGQFTRKDRLRKLTSNLKVPDTPWLPAKNNARNFYSHYVESNKALNERFALSQTQEDPFSQDFSDYPPVSAVSNRDLDATFRALFWEIEKLQK